MKIICIIPARGGSSRIINKNLVYLGGYPLIAWTIRDALESKLIDRVIVSTDDERIADISKKYGAEVIMRPGYLSTDTSQVEEAILYTLNSIEEKPDYIVFLQCTTPFRNEGDIDNGIIKIIQDDSDSLFFACNLNKFIWSRDNTCLSYDYRYRPRTQDKKWEIIELGNYISRPSVYFDHKNRLGGKISHILVNDISSIDIDTEFDLNLARGLVKELDLRC